MKQLITALLVLLAYTPAIAQKDIPPFGKVEKSDLEMTACDFDNAAEAEVLFDVGEVFCTLNLTSLTGNFVNTEFERRVRIKILNDKGLSQANIKLRYRSEQNVEDIKNIAAQTMNLDAAGNIVYTKVDKNLIYRKKLNKHFSEVIFTFPEVKKGSIIEFKYTDKADGFYAVKNWYFQRSIPVKFSRYTMNFPNELIVNASNKGVLHVDVAEKQLGYRNLKTYTMQNIPALRDEAYISCEDDYMQQVEPILVALDLPGKPRVDLLNTWPRIIKNLMEDEDFGLQLKKNIPRTSDLDAMLTKITDPYQKMVIIHDYVRKNMQWNESYGIWALDGVKSAWKDKKGTSGEINLILVNLLKDADLVVHPVLVSTRDNGRVNTGVPGYDQFDKVMAYVEIGDEVYVLDATDKYTPAKLIPRDVLFSEGLVIEKISTFDWGWKTLWKENKLLKNTTILMGHIEPDGLMKGEATVTSFDYGRLSRMPVLRDSKAKLIETFFTSKTNGVAIDSIDLSNEAVDSLPLVQHVNFSCKTSSSGDYHYFTPNLFSGLEKIRSSPITGSPMYFSGITSSTTSLEILRSQMVMHLTSYPKI